MKDIILTGIAIICGGGVILFSALFCAFACALQKQEGAEKRP
jgi:hypothetical protein